MGSVPSSMSTQDRSPGVWVPVGSGLLFWGGNSPAGEISSRVQPARCPQDWDGMLASRAAGCSGADRAGKVRVLGGGRVALVQKVQADEDLQLR